MKVAYVFRSDMASTYQLGTMILPQLEEDFHGAEVRRGLADGTPERCGRGEVTARGTVEGVTAGCFPQLYEALGGNPPDQVITL